MAEKHAASKPTPGYYRAVERSQSEERRLQPPRVGRITAERKLHFELSVLADKYADGSMDEQRVAVLQSLTAVTQYLEDRGFPFPVLKTLRRPAFALANREDNLRDPLFCEGKRKGKPADTFLQVRYQGILAGLAIVWLKVVGKNGHTIPTNLNEAARNIKLDCWPEAITGKQLGRYRHEISQRAKDDPMVLSARNVEEIYDQNLAYNENRRALFDEIVNHLNNLVIE